MNTPQRARPAGNRDSMARHARAGPESVVSSIPQQASPEARIRVPSDMLHRPPGRDTPVIKRAARFWRYLLLLLAGGTIATALSVLRAVGWPAEARPGAGPWLVAGVAAGLGTGILSAITCMYRDRQETKRTEIQQRWIDMVAAAFARSIDATHVRAENLPAAKEMVEAARVRESARQANADLAPTIATLLQEPSPVLAREHQEAAAGTEPGQLVDQVPAN
jgi:hypothetical protein